MAHGENAAQNARNAKRIHEALMAGIGPESSLAVNGFANISAIKQHRAKVAAMKDQRRSGASGQIETKRTNRYPYKDELVLVGVWGPNGREC